MNQSIVELLRHNSEHVDEFRHLFDDVQDSQRPDVVTVCCSDSRVLQDRMWGNDRPGQIFTCGNIGNRVIQRTGTTEAVSGDVLYPVAHTETNTIVIAGHTGCGAVTATYDDIETGLSEPPGIEHCLSLLKPGLEPGVEALPPELGRAESINRLVEYNVDRQVDFLHESDEVPETVDIFGVVYDFQDVYSGNRGEVHVVNVDGEIDTGQLRAEYPEIASRIERLWEYDTDRSA